LVHLVALVSLYSKLIGWVIEGIIYAAAEGDQALLLVVFFSWCLWTIDWCTDFFHCTIQVSGL